MNAPKIHEKWIDILKNAWSVRFMALSAILSSIATSLTIAQPYLSFNPLWLATIVGIATMAACLIGIYARVVKQQGID